MFKIVHLLQSKNLIISKGVIRRYVIRRINKKSFQYQVLNYFQNIHDTRTATEQHEVSTQVRKAAIKNNLNQETFQSICQQINNLPEEYKIRQSFLSSIDFKCLELINSLSHSEILNLLNLLLKIFSPKELKNTQFYNTSMDMLFQALEYELLTWQEIVQLSYFISLRKDEARSYMHYLKLCLPNIKDVALIEKCIIAEAFYKSSLKLDQSQCRVLEEVLSENSEELISNAHLLVPICKAIRISLPTSQLDLTNLSHAIVNMKQPFNIMAAVHVLSLYSEALVHEPDAVACLVDQCMQIIEHSEYLRLKDVDRFLWAVSHLGYHLNDKEKHLLIRVIEKNLQELKMKENVGLLVNSLLSLHILECWNPKVIENCFEEKVFEPVYYEKFHWKVRSRLHLLINQIDIEMNLYIPEPLRKEIRIAHTVPEEINAAEKMLNSLVEEKFIQSIMVECPVQGLLIPGISLATETSLYHIDLLNDFTCLRNTSIPHGLMQLKSRLLTHFKCHHIVLEGLLIEDPDKMRSAVQEQISRTISES